MWLILYAALALSFYIFGFSLLTLIPSPVGYVIIVFFIIDSVLVAFKIIKSIIIFLRDLFSNWRLILRMFLLGAIIYYLNTKVFTGNNALDTFDYVIIFIIIYTIFITITKMFNSLKIHLFRKRNDDAPVYHSFSEHRKIKKNLYYYISELQFKHLVERAVLYTKNVTDALVIDGTVYLILRSNSKKNTWYASLDFAPSGTINGNYFVRDSDNYQSSIPERFGKNLQQYISAKIDKM